MNIFFSHSSRDKALVREVLSYLPDYIKPWLDERKIFIGMNLDKTLEATIKASVDFLVIFLDSNSIASEWVRRELTWALEMEEKLKRVFVLPVLLEDVWNQVEPQEFQQKRYLPCLDQSKSTVRNLANQLAEQLIQLFILSVEAERLAKQEYKFVEGTEQVYREAESAIKDTKDHIRVVLVGPRPASPDYVWEAIIKVLETDQSIRYEGVFVIDPNDSSYNIEEEFKPFFEQMKKRIKKQQYKFYTVSNENPVGFDGIIIDETHVGIGFTRTEGYTDIQKATFFPFNPKVATEFAKWFDRVLRKQADEFFLED